VIDEYFNMRSNRPPADRGPSSSPGLTEMLKTFMDSWSIERADGVLLAAYMAYTAWSHEMFRQRLVTVYDWLLQNNLDLLEDWHVLDSERQLRHLLNEQEAAIQNMKKEEKSKRKATGQHKQKGVQSLTDKAKTKLVETVNTMMRLLNDASVVDMGPFFRTYLRVGAAMESLATSDGGLPMPDPTAEYVDVSIYKPYMEWMQFLLEHGDSVPIDDPASWSNTKLLEFLAKHGVTTVAPQATSELLLRKSSFNFALPA